MAGNDDVAAVAHEIATSLQRDIDTCRRGAFGRNKRRIELYVLPEGYVLNVAQQRRRQCTPMQLRPELFNGVFPLEDILLEVIGNIVTSNQLGYSYVTVERVMADVYSTLEDDYSHEDQPVIRILLDK